MPRKTAVQPTGDRSRVTNGARKEPIRVNDADKWVELARLRQRVQNLEDDLGLEMRTMEPATGNQTLDLAIQALVAEHASDVIAVHKANGDFEFVTPSITRSFGYRPEKLVGRNGYDIVHPDDIEAVAASHAKLMDGPQTIEYRLRTADGGWRWVESRGQALIVGSALSRVVVITRDVHDRRLAQEALERSNADLQQFALVAAHDLHEPLRIAASFADLLDRRYREALDERGQGYLDFIVSNMSRMRGLIDGLLALTRLEVDRSRFMLVDLGLVFAEVRQTMSAALKACGASMEIGPLPTITGDAEQLTRLFVELVTNAIKFRDPERPLRLRVRSERVAGGYIIGVSDNGQGADEVDVDGVFDMFQRLVGPDVPGSGIGLAVVARVAEYHGGRAWMEPRAEGGVTVNVQLPDTTHA